MVTPMSTAPDVFPVRTSDGYQLSVNDYGQLESPTVVLVHGYPDSSVVWSEVIAALMPRYRVVTYDVRGAGHSDKPEHVSEYRLEQLTADLTAVLDRVSPKHAVHLIGHDWGSIQCWHALTDARVQARIASFTSISGPHLDHAGAWLRGAAAGSLRDRARQLVSSAYLGVFVAPRLPEWLWRRGVADRVVGEHGPTGSLADKLHGLKLYRANLPGRAAAPARASLRVPIPTQVLAPEHDPYVSVALQTQAPAPWTERLRVHTIDGGHWAIRTHGELVARHASAFIDEIEAAQAATNNARAQ
ncbi:MAG: putative oxidoreductase SadH [Pseudomonadota bacterium]|jgi:pimeloyl-ACP methyl ester carboxylesterase